MMKQFIYLSSFLFFIIGCNKNMEDDLSNSKVLSADDGQWKDVIGLSTDTVQFSGRKDTALIHTEGANWWFESITVDGVKYEITAEANKTQLEKSEFFQVCDWLTIDRRPNDITLIAASNTINDLRTFELSLQGGDYFDYIRGTQEIRLVGDWDDCIGLSENKVEFAAEGGTFIINTQDYRWWLYSIEIDGVEINIGNEGGVFTENGKEFIKKYDWLTIHASYKKIELTVDPNITSVERLFRINLQAGNYFDYIEGKQGK